MACSAVRSPILRNSTVRHYAALAKAAQSSPAATTDFQVLSNKVVVAAFDENSPVAKITIAFRAGSRDQTYETQGLCHLLRLVAGLTTSRSTIFGITKYTQQFGANLFATTERESTSYTLQVTRNNLERTLIYLEDVATRQVFRAWQIPEVFPRYHLEMASRTESARLVELLHEAAFRRGLGYSLYSPKDRIDQMSTECLQEFCNNHFTGPRCAVVGTGISLSHLSSFANSLNMNSGNATSTPSKYWGGERRKELNSHIASVAFAVEGSGLDKEKDALAFAVLAKAAGTGPQVKWGGSSGPLHKSLSSAAGNEPFAVTAFNANYTDSGLFGLFLQASPNIAGAVTKAAAKWMAAPNISDADIARGKYALKASIMFASDNRDAHLENLAQQTLFMRHPVSCAALAAEVDKVTVADVKKAAGKLSGKLSMAAVGNLVTVPHIDQLN